LSGSGCDVEHVEADARDRFGIQRRDQRFLVDDRPARGVDEIGGLFHQAELFRADDAARAFAQHHMDADDVALRKQVFLGDVIGTGSLAFSGVRFWLQG